MSSLPPLFGAGFGKQTRLGGEAQPASPSGEDFGGGDPVTSRRDRCHGHRGEQLGDKMSAGFTGREAPPVRGARPDQPQFQFNPSNTQEFVA